MAFDLFDISTILLECKHTFNKTSYIIAVQMSNLSLDIMEEEKSFCL